MQVTKMWPCIYIKNWGGKVLNCAHSSHPDLWTVSVLLTHSHLSKIDTFTQLAPFFKKLLLFIDSSILNVKFTIIRMPKLFIREKRHQCKNSVE